MVHAKVVNVTVSPDSADQHVFLRLDLALLRVDQMVSVTRRVRHVNALLVSLVQLVYQRQIHVTTIATSRDCV